MSEKLFFFYYYIFFEQFTNYFFRIKICLIESELIKEFAILKEKNDINSETLNKFVYMYTYILSSSFFFLYIHKSYHTLM